MYNVYIYRSSEESPASIDLSSFASEDDLKEDDSGREEDDERDVVIRADNDLDTSSEFVYYTITPRLSREGMEEEAKNKGACLKAADEFQSSLDGEAKIVESLRADVWKLRQIRNKWLINFHVHTTRKLSINLKNIKLRTTELVNLVNLKILSDITWLIYSKL